jgi:heme exporter protein D
MHWPDLASFLSMGGYALYVWGSVGACALAMAVEALGVRARRRRIEAALRDEFAAGPDGGGEASSR